MRKILISFLNLLIIIVLFAAATFAWFSDTAINQNNRIQVGNLKVSIVAANGLSYEEPLWNLNDQNLQDLNINSEPLFDFDGRVEPGQTLTRYIRIKNIGTIAMDYEVYFTVNENFIEQYIEFTISSVEIVTGLHESMIEKLGTNLTDLTFSGSALLHNQYMIHKVTIKISEDLGNDHKDDMLTTESFDFDFKLIAWQSLYPESKPQI
jgi:hypothetical protein